LFHLPIFFRAHSWSRPLCISFCSREYSTLSVGDKTQHLTRRATESGYEHTQTKSSARTVAGRFRMLHRTIGTKAKRDALGLPHSQPLICRSLRGCAPESTARHRPPHSRIIPPGYFLG
jgi:muramidase (phage lysozyme)